MITPREEHLLSLIRVLLDNPGDPQVHELVERDVTLFTESDKLPAGWNRPAPASTSELVRLLLDVVGRVHAGDSFEGTITYTMPTDEPELEGADFGVMARYRVGNLDGQGGLRVFSKGDGDG